MPEKSDLFKALSTHTIIFQLIGLQFFTLDGINSRKFLTKHKYNLGIIFVVLMLIAFSAIYLVEKSKEKQDKPNVATSTIMHHISMINMICCTVISMVQSFLVKAKVRKIFFNLQSVAKIFSKNFNCDVDYSVLGREFKNFCFGYFLFYAVLSLALVAFLLGYGSGTSGIMWNILLLCPYSFLIICFIRFVFFVMLIKFHVVQFERIIKSMQKCSHPYIRADNILRDYRIKIDRSPAVEFEFVMGLKKIYGIIVRTTRTVNFVCGIINLMILFLIVFATINGGYKVFLSSKNDITLEQLGGLIEIFYETFNLLTI